MAECIRSRTHAGDVILSKPVPFLSVAINPWNKSLPAPAPDPNRGLEDLSFFGSGCVESGCPDWYVEVRVGTCVGTPSDTRCCGSCGMLDVRVVVAVKEFVVTELSCGGRSLDEVTSMCRDGCKGRECSCWGSPRPGPLLGRVGCPSWLPSE